MQDSQRIVKNVENLLNKYNKYIDSDPKLVLLYLKTYEKLRFDGSHISTRDFLNIDLKLVQQILDAKYILQLLEDGE